MRRFLNSTKFKMIFVPVLFFMLFGCQVVATILKQEQQLPTKGWSRAIDLKTTTLKSTDVSNEIPYIENKNGSYYIYTKGKTSVNELVLDSRLNVTKRGKLPAKLPPFTAFWTDGTKVIFVKNHQLVQIENQETKRLDSKVDGMTTLNGNVIYWKSNQIYEYIPLNNKLERLLKVPYPIDSIVTKRGSDSCLVISEVVKTQYVYLGVFSFKKPQVYHALDRLDQPYSASLDDFDFVTDQSKMYLSYSKVTTGQNGLSTNDLLDTYNIQAYKKIGKERYLNITDAVTHLSFANPTHVRIFWNNGKLTILFEEMLTLFHGDDAQNIFLAVKQRNRNTWIGKPISNTEEPSGNPVLLTNNTVLWNDLDGDQFTLKLASQDPAIIQKSYSLSHEDWNHAMSQALINMSLSILILGYALLWAIPTFLFMFVLLIGFTTTMEKNPKWIKYVGMGLFLLTQLFFVKGLFNYSFYQFGPSFLKFPGDVYIIPIAVMLLSWGLTEWIKNKDWGTGLFIFYSLLLDVLLLGFLVGPYIM